jgi:hypothetical protein
LQVGTTDQAKQFHPFGLLITKREKTADYRFMFETVCQLVFNIGEKIYLGKFI